VLGPADAAAGVDADLEEADLAQALEEGAYRVGVQAERPCDVVGGERPRRARQLEEDRVARVVAEGLEHREARRLLDRGLGLGVGHPA
jgi:hypothetical protein